MIATTCTVASATAYTYFDGLVSDIGVLSALESEGTDLAVARLAELATDDGWEQPFLAAVWARRHGTPGAEALAHRTADILLSEGEATEAGTNWPFVPRRFTTDLPPERRDRQMPNWSHGLAGSSTAPTWSRRRAPAPNTS